MQRDLIEHFIKFNGQTVGKDKVFRLMQYGSKLVWWLLQQTHNQHQLVTKLKSLEYGLSTARKLLRLGKFLEHMYAALKSLHITDMVLQLSITLSRIGQSLYLLMDNIIWLTRVGLVKTDEVKLNRTAARFWLVSIIMGLVRDLYDFWLTLSRELQIRDVLKKRSHYYTEDMQKSGDKNRLPKSYFEIALNIVRTNHPLLLDFVRNICDLFIPMNTVGHINISPGMIGCLGVISSIIGIATTWEPMFKLVPI